MRHTELRQFIQSANAEGLSPAEKDVFLYYASVTNGGRWHCPDEEVAEKIGRSRSGVCVARKSLKSRGWIDEKRTFSICILKEFSPESAPETTENDENLSQDSNSTVRNLTPQLETELYSQDSNSTVRNLTGYKDKRNREEKLRRETKKKKEPDSPELVAFRSSLTDFQKQFAPPATQGQAIAQNKAIRTLFALARGDTSVCIEAHQALRAQKWREGRVDWTTVVKEFNYLQNNKQQVRPKFLH